jgi:hypothetical protein
MARTLIPYQSVNGPRIDFKNGRFETLIDQKGYDVLWKRMVVCPCRKELTAQPQSECVNCRGTGYYYLSGVQIKALITNAMLQKNFAQQWSEVLQGTVNLTVESEYKIGWMDSFAVLNAESVYSEVGIVKLQPNVGSFYVTTHYTPTTPLSLFRFLDVEASLQQIATTNVTIGEVEGQPALLIADDNLTTDQQVTVLYEHHPEYLVIDILNDYRNTKIKDHEPVEKLARMPLRAMMKRKHLVL